MLSAIPVVAQEQTATIEGVVTDPSGAALPGVSIGLVSANGQRLSATTDGAGRYRFPAVPPGIYAINATLEGMQKTTIKDVQVTLGAPKKVDVQMKLAHVSESVTVSAEAPIVDVTSSATTNSIRAETFERLPKGRDFTSIATLAPGARNDPKAGGITVDGASGSENKYIMDGVDTTNPQTGVSGKVLVTDFVDEVQVKSAGYQAEFGGAVGGVINVITKTGTNELKGSVGGYYTNRAWGGGVRPTLQIKATDPNASEYHTFPRDDNKVVEPGFTLGGPVMRDRLWFFAAYEPAVQNIDRTPEGFTQSYSQDFRRDNGVLNLTGSATSKFLYKFAFNNSGYKTTNLLPGVNGRGNPNPSLYTGKNDKFINWTASGYADFVANSSSYSSLRGGRFFRNYRQSGISTDPRYVFSGSNSVFSDAPPSQVHPSGYSSIPTNTATQKDAYTRDNVNLDTSWFTQFMGEHRLKGGVQIENLKNQVLDGEQNYRVTIYWNRANPLSGTRGKYGAVRVRQFRRTGDVTSKNLGLFLQDSWTTLNDRLTLNIGLRGEQEKVPSYATEGITGRYAVNWGYGDKLAPRLGFSYDVRGDGRTKAYGSYGRFYDIMKMELPRGSFGGEKWIDASFDLNTVDYLSLNCQGITNSITQRPTCNGATFVYNVDFRHPANAADLNLIDPKLKPMQQEEYTVGMQHELSPTMAIGARLTRKHLVRTIEDTGVLVTNPDGSQEEQFFIANPGEGVARHILGADLPSMPKPKRDYNGLEVEFTRRFSNRLSLHASYLYSRLTGNYSGLANSDEAVGSGNARTSPNVNRAFDGLFNLFNAQGKAVVGRLATDRPHQFKAQAAYAFAFGTTIGVNQYVGSGTPFQTEFSVSNIPFFAFGRGDMGRSPWLKQTDLNLTHEIRLGGGYALALGVNVLNLFDTKTVLNIYDVYSGDNLRMRDANGNALAVGSHAEAQAFFKGFDPKALCALQKCFVDPFYGKPNAFQDPREVRLSARLIF
ncbi:MAG TPA: carboxypeptidase regulatory-like domain-containing protein [Thermoanaerobaculia bacterium]|nr:carboxypeptidase regulatory-like domain-containing protein [Thermoanaerobaculia bacterium]